MPVDLNDVYAKMQAIALNFPDDKHILRFELYNDGSGVVYFGAASRTFISLEGLRHCIVTIHDFGDLPF